MNHNKGRTWVSLFTLLALLVASFFSVPQSNAFFLFTKSAHSERHQIHHVTAPDCVKTQHALFSEYDGDKHHSCASLCLLKVPCGQSITLKAPLLSALALIHKDDIGKAIIRIQSLFRPPIA